MDTTVSRVIEFSTDGVVCRRLRAGVWWWAAFVVCLGSSCWRQSAPQEPPKAAEPTERRHTRASIGKDPQGRAIVSILLLLREPADFDAAVLEAAAKRAWSQEGREGQRLNVQVTTLPSAGLGDSEGSGQPPAFFMLEPQGPTGLPEKAKFFFLCFPRPYYAEKQPVAESLESDRLRQLWNAHGAWISCELFLDTPAQETAFAQNKTQRRRFYHLAGQLIAELIDENTLLLILPEYDLWHAIGETTVGALRAADPVAALRGLRVSNGTDAARSGQPHP